MTTVKRADPVADEEVIQVVMTGTFYRAHFLPLVEQQGFTVIEFSRENELELRTLGLGLGEQRGALLRSMNQHLEEPS